MAIDDDQLVPNAESARILGISLRWKNEREKLDPDFPATYRFNGRKYHKRGDLRAYVERGRAASETKNAGWQVTQTHPRARGKFTAATTESVTQQAMPDELGTDATETPTIMHRRIEKKRRAVGRPVAKLLIGPPSTEAAGW
jgi:hypothetical protein